MYGPVEKSELDNEADRLLDEFYRALVKAQSTYDLTYAEFVPSGWHKRLREYVESFKK